MSFRAVANIGHVCRDGSFLRPRRRLLRKIKKPRYAVSYLIASKSYRLAYTPKLLAPGFARGLFVGRQVALSGSRSAIRPMSALPRKTDTCGATAHVCAGDLILSKLQLYRRKAGKAQGARRRRRDVDNPPPHERTAVIDPHSNAAPIAPIGHAHVRAECQLAMRSGKSAGICPFAARGFSAGIRIHGCNSGLSHRTRRAGDEKHGGTANYSDDANDTNNPVVGVIVGVVHTQNAACHFNSSQEQTDITRGRRGIATTHQREPVLLKPRSLSD